MKLLHLVAVAACAVTLSGCATAVVKDLSPEAKRELALKFIERCGGSVNIGASGATGQLGGGFTGSFSITGTCPVPQAPPAGPPAVPEPAT